MEPVRPVRKVENLWSSIKHASTSALQQTLKQESNQGLHFKKRFQPQNLVTNFIQVT